ncbi:tRNA lysidine(34) synthetase TilS [Roseisolibacter agri]|uniref:tRNA(Ile)-lysidine synthase n=1 Tax=Roseisolibacter agri TaxID=2014610 RepID=A0AA37Q9Z3_9BACT|nr:tRNA lysidine(34) synthetase TilS [Roseisolibacter agri]GLC26447.1 tRNA(Ile)-lysidine synthase [Roseisolibacter agri]
MTTPVPVERDAERDADARRSIRAVRARVRAALADGASKRVVLAVSGGRDSMVLLDAACAVARERLAGVAVFDHGTGPHARAAVRRVRRAAARHGLPVVVGRAALPDAGEAVWREARWRFLRRAARRLGADAVATAHTRDDQVETVAMRVLRGAGPRGLAGLLATRQGVVRPLLAVGAARVAAYAHARGLRWVEDPSNASRRFLRNRLRHELLPALEAARPGTRRLLLALGREAAAWRAEAEALAESVAVTRAADGALHVALPLLAGYDAEGLAVLWPALAARGGVRLDRRGTARLVAFTIRVAAEATAVGAGIPLAGGIEVVVRRGRRVPGGREAQRELVLRRAAAWRPTASPPGNEPLADGLTFGGWRFGASQGEAAAVDPAWSAWLPADRPLEVRAWRPGDRIRAAGKQGARRVKRFLAEAGIPGRERPGWPVVVAGGDGQEILWIPGVCRSDAATDRHATPGQHFICERIDRRPRPERRG